MEIKKAFVLGSGIMGSGIVQLMAQNGIEVIMADVEESIVRKSLEKVQQRLIKRVEKGKMTEEQINDILGRIKTSTNIKDAADSDFVIEAIVENVKVKQKVFEELDEITREHVILATNTTACSISEIASVVKNPGRVIGMHFFNPAVVMKLVEIMPGMGTSEETILKTKTFAEFIGKEPVVTEKEGIAGIARTTSC